jgi:hypothetical protein
MEYVSYADEKILSVKLLNIVVYYVMRRILSNIIYHDLFLRLGPKKEEEEEEKKINHLNYTWP